MSNTPQGPGWWQASDGLWYPRQPANPLPPPPASAPSSTPPKRSGLSPLLIVGIVAAAVVVLVLVAAVVLVAVSGGDDEPTAGDGVTAFEDPEAMVDALVAAGVECENFSDEQASLSAFGIAAAEASGECELDGSTMRVDIFASSEDRSSSVRAFEDIFRGCAGEEEGVAGESKILVAGENWIATVEEEFQDDPEGSQAVSTALDADRVSLACNG